VKGYVDKEITDLQYRKSRELLDDFDDDKAKIDDVIKQAEEKIKRMEQHIDIPEDEKLFSKEQRGN